MAAPSSLTERKNSYFHSLSKVLTNETQYSFESKYKSSHTIKFDDVWIDNIDYCSSAESADLFVLNNPTIIKKYDKTPLTEIPGSNGQAWYINDNKFIRALVSPVDVPNDITNLPSVGFEVKLYKEDGSLISPTSGVWYIDYYAGIVHFESSSTPNDLNYGIPKITAYSYIGKTLKDKIDELEHQAVSQTNTKIITTPHLLITNNKITLPKIALGDIIFNTARIYEINDYGVFTEYNCSVNVEGTEVIFDAIDNLNGKYAIVSYMTKI